MADFEDLIPQKRDMLRIIKYIAKSLDNFWNYKIVTVGEDSIAISNIVVGVIIFFALMRMKKYAQTMIRARFSRVKQLDSNMKEALQKIIDYVLLALVILFTLKMSNVPMTAFAFVGGALALGLGLGSQNIINNFISGLILMFEQPIKIGDIVTIGSDTGQVTTIGARCTHLATGDKMYVLIPNSTILQSTITNWTYDNDIIRSKIFFKLPQSNDPSEVIKIIYNALINHPGIIKNDDTEVYITDYNDNIITYDATFYVHVFGEISKSKTVTEVYQEVFKQLRAKGMKIEFPVKYVTINESEF